VGQTSRSARDVHVAHEPHHPTWKLRIEIEAF
jgi:hypothetical protein